MPYPRKEKVPGGGGGGRTSGLREISLVRVWKECSILRLLRRKDHRTFQTEFDLAVIEDSKKRIENTGYGCGS